MNVKKLSRAPAAAGWQWPIILAGGLIVLAGLAAYGNSFYGSFIYDDRVSIVENSTIRHCWPIWKAFAPSSTSLLGGRPVLHCTLAVNYALGGLSPWGYHLVNLVIHLLAGLLLFGIVRRTLLRPALAARFGSSAVPLALAVALGWVVHPLQTAAVTYVSQRCESLMGLFYLGLGRWCLPVFLALSLGSGVLTWQRNRDYRTGEAIWSDIQKRTIFWGGP